MPSTDSELIDLLLPENSGSDNINNTVSELFGKAAREIFHKLQYHEKGFKVCIADSQSLTATIRHFEPYGITQHSVTCHPTQVNAPRLTPSQ